ncbi:GDP dissociation inhibitor-domain-containing protein [Scheffersomyces amazonensis]|uniref:GDP dissociation inhibitor-domain-containing protein n=1 Tax=Scheffersomyces amazonensis TaxID=1078765 RepID=UPI00315D9936
MPPFSRVERRESMAERRPSMSYTPPVIPHLEGLEKPQQNHIDLDQADVLILGTGLIESMLAAALSWQGVQVLHIDNKSYYGDATSTLTIDQLKKWCIDVNQGKLPNFQDAQIYIPGGKSTNKFKSKDYGIDLTPKIMFCKSDLLSLLIKSRVYKYLEFQSLSNFHVFENDDFNQKITNSTSKEDIFTDKSLSLITKRNLMKFLKFILTDNKDSDKKRLIFENSKTNIIDFLTNNFNLESPQINELVYSIGLCIKPTTKTPEAVAKIKRFLVSFDVYGNFPVMVSKYGGPGEISQGFCRSAAVAGTTYKLNTNLIDYDPNSKIASFNDGSKVKINEKIIISPTQLPKFLQSSYNQLVDNSLPTYNITRLITVVRRDCKEWMSNQESSAIVVFPPLSLPTQNNQSVQVIIQNGGTGVCPNGQSIWFSHTSEPDLNRAKADLESAFEKMEASLLRESSSNLENGLDEQDFRLNPNRLSSTPILVNSFKLGEQLQNFVPKEKLEIVCKVGYVQKTLINPDLTNVFQATESNNIILKSIPDSNNNIIFTNMLSSELSYDGIITETKLIYSKITGSDEDFFDVDFEDEEEFDNNNGDSSAIDDSSSTGTNGGASAITQSKSTTSIGGIVGGGVVAGDENVIEDSSEDDMAIDDDDEDHDVNDNHEPFGTDVDNMEL